jgi:PTH1 family peptidyl-tRNA hydrolase
MKVIVGLGNPGSEYQLTRHNAGFQALNQLGTISGGEWKLVKNLSSLAIKGRLGEHDVLLAMPQTYMNHSGSAVLAILQWFKISPKDMLVVHDDVSLNLGRLRLQHGGGAGGQHGIESIIEVLGKNNAFDRLKIGVGPDPGGDVRANYVLSKFPQEDWDLYRTVILAAKDAALTWLKQGVNASMNIYNGNIYGEPLNLRLLNEEKKRSEIKPAPIQETQESTGEEKI